MSFLIVLSYLSLVSASNVIPVDEESMILTTPTNAPSASNEPPALGVIVASSSAAVVSPDEVQEKSHWLNRAVRPNTVGGRSVRPLVIPQPSNI